MFGLRALVVTISVVLNVVIVEVTIVICIDMTSNMTFRQLRLYLRFSHGFVSTECNVGPIINIILLELLVLMAI